MYPRGGVYTLGSGSYKMLSVRGVPVAVSAWSEPRNVSAPPVRVRLTVEAVMEEVPAADVKQWAEFNATRLRPVRVEPDGAVRGCVSRLVPDLEESPPPTVRGFVLERAMEPTTLKCTGVGGER